MRSNRISICHFGMIILAVIFSPGGARPQTPSAAPSRSPVPSTSSPALEKDFFKNILRDQKAIWTPPLHIHGRDARYLVPLGLGTAALIATDQRTGDEIAESPRPLNASRIISYAGPAYAVGAVAATFYLAGRAGHNDRARETGLLGAEALIDSAIVVTAVKEITQRTRPIGGRSRSDFFDGGSSFPSGHSIEAWSLATIIANEYHNHAAVQIGAYGIASAVSVSRFTGRDHYLSDILVGSALGYGIGRYVYHAHHRKTSSARGDDQEEEDFSSQSKHLPAIEPLYNHRAHDYGVALAWRF
ncbi:MAG: phosphatase PAP2 family protein [Pyrinomonadaceae bacterium]